jgi:acetyltransferase
MSLDPETQRALDALYDPASVAVVGASPDSWYASNTIDNLLSYGYDGTLHLVNPGRDEAWGRPCHDSITDVPEVVDLAVVSVPRQYVVEVVRDAGEMGVPVALVITAGFGEADDEGERSEAELAETAREAGIRVVGPNCIGFASGRTSTVLTPTCSRKPDPGRIGLASQSGALAFATFYERGADADVDFAYVVSTGNEADLSVTDHVAYMADDPDVDVVCAYVEGVEDPRRFVQTAREATRSGTPVLVAKIGRSEAGQAAAASHTGSITGADAVWDDTLRQVGAERVPDVPDLVERASVHAAFDPPAGDRVCVASTSGGLATLLADLCEDRGLSLPALAAETEQAMLDMEDLLTFGEMHNPADIRGYGADVIGEIADLLFADDYDAYLFAVGLSAVDERASEIADDLIEAVDRAEKPVVLLWTGRRDPADLPDPQPYERLREEVPLFADPARAVDALASLVGAAEARERVPAAPESPAPAGGVDLSAAAGLLTWKPASRLLSAYDVETVETGSADSAEQAVAAAEAVGYPVVLKVDSADVGHRARVGGVRVGLDDEAAVRAAYDEMREAVAANAPDADVAGVLVQPMTTGVEALVGATREAGFGPVVTVGRGGGDVEALGDAAHVLAPATPAEVRTALARTELPALAEAAGVEGALAALAETAARVSELIAAEERVAELDLNPVILDADGAHPVDVLVRTDGE